MKRTRLARIVAFVVALSTWASARRIDVSDAADGIRICLSDFAANAVPTLRSVVGPKFVQPMTWNRSTVDYCTTLDTRTFVAHNMAASDRTWLLLIDSGEVHTLCTATLHAAADSERAALVVACAHETVDLTSALRSGDGTVAIRTRSRCVTDGCSRSHIVQDGTSCFASEIGGDGCSEQHWTVAPAGSSGCTIRMRCERSAPVLDVAMATTDIGPIAPTRTFAPGNVRLDLRTAAPANGDNNNNDGNHKPRWWTYLVITAFTVAIGLVLIIGLARLPKDKQP